MQISIQRQSVLRGAHDYHPRDDRGFIWVPNEVVLRSPCDKFVMNSVRFFYSTENYWAEIWEDRGDDGHVEYINTGNAVLIPRHLWQGSNFEKLIHFVNSNCGSSRFGDPFEALDHFISWVAEQLTVGATFNKPIDPVGKYKDVEDVI